jgi:hypothetical protein
MNLQGVVDDVSPTGSKIIQLTFKHSSGLTGQVNVLGKELGEVVGLAREIMDNFASITAQRVASRHRLLGSSLTTSRQHSENAGTTSRRNWCRRRW